MPDYAAARRNMVDSQLRTNRVTDLGILAAMGEVPREVFVPPHLAGVAYVDEDIAIGRGRYLMEPMVLGRLLQAAQIQPSDMVLDIGCATGYSSAAAARLAATVIGLESDSELAKAADDNFAKLRIDNAAVMRGELRVGCPRQAPFDVILFQGAVSEIPPEIAVQLGEGGRLVVVVAPPGRTGRATLALKTVGVVSYRELFDATTPPLPGLDLVQGFRF
jgi:protein-L-isoaspartate(D-aspartate) O-methyltransferase